MDASASGVAGQKTLLLVDDQERMRQAMAEILQREGYRTVEASDPDAALETLHAVHVDLVVVDQMPPEMAGWRVLEALEKNALDVPVIVVSDYLPQDRKEVPARAPAGFLTKPVMLNDLLNLVRRVLFPPPPPSRRQRILVADDEEDMRLLIAACLERAGFEVETAPDGERALDQVKKRPPDLILLDLAMPRMHGFEVLRELRAHPDPARIPVIMLTAKTSSEYVRKAAALKVDGYIAKPPDPDDLIVRIRKILPRVEEGAERVTMPEERCIDDAALEKLRKLGGPEFVVKMLDLFLENAPVRIEAARAGQRAGDLKAVEMAVHSLKSSAGNLGARELQQIAGRIEDLAEAGKGDGLSALLDDLESTFARVKTCLEAERKRP